MRKVAFILFIVFATVQVAPAVMALFSQTISVFITDEEKTVEKGHSSDSKEKKDYTDLFSPSAILAKKNKHCFSSYSKDSPLPLYGDTVSSSEFLLIGISDFFTCMA